MLKKDGTKYRAGDFVFLRPGIFDEVQDTGSGAPQVADYASKGRFHKGGANFGLRPYGIAQLLDLSNPKKVLPLHSSVL